MSSSSSSPPPVSPDADDAAPASVAFIAVGIILCLLVIVRCIAQRIRRRVEGDESAASHAPVRRNIVNQYVSFFGLIESSKIMSNTKKDDDHSNYATEDDDDDDDSAEINFLTEIYPIMQCLVLATPSIFLLGLVQLNFERAIELSGIPALIFWIVRMSQTLCRPLPAKEDLPPTLVANNIFENLQDVSMSRAILVGMGQLTMIVLYIYGLWESGRPNFGDRQVYLFYWLGTFIQVCYTVGKGKMDSHSDFWTNVRGHHVASGSNVMTRELWMRWMLSIIINSFGFLWIMTILPLQACRQSDPINFVLKAVSAFYIIAFDDLPNPKVMDPQKIWRPDATAAQPGAFTSLMRSSPGYGAIAEE